jgi:2,3-bisphosphoglycerate-independent phosphoglycerate mutase
MLPYFPRGEAIDHRRTPAKRGGMHQALARTPRRRHVRVTVNPLVRQPIDAAARLAQKGLDDGAERTSIMQQRRPVMLVVLDGWGWREETADNAVRLARTPSFDRLWATCPRAFLRTSGRAVGLPEGQMGNSEVGHLNIGAGRVVMQDLPRIGDAIASGEIARMPAILDLVARLKASGGTCHLMGLLSAGGVHAHQDHAVALARVLADAGVASVVHAFTDGRDTPPRAGAACLKSFASALPAGVRVATVCGRYYAMDRDNRWERVEKAYRLLTAGEGARFDDVAAAMADAYAGDNSDEFVLPGAIGDYKGMTDGDGLLCFNFRADRVREILAALLDPAFEGFARGRTIRFAAAAGLTEYSAELNPFLSTVFASQSLDHVLGAVVAKAGRRQLRMAETEKYPHVTYFLNGGEETPYPGEDRIMVPSPKVATYDLQPEMSAPELTDKAVAAIGSGTYDLIVLNFANPDMVGHTGSLPAAIRAVETVDASLGRIATAIDEAGGALLVTADHGNCELMRDPETGGPHTAHTTTPVPVMLVGGGAKGLRDGRLADLAPTLLALMGIRQPEAMTGMSLIM